MEITNDLIRDELQRRGWSASRLGREAGLNQVTAVEIANGTRKPGPTARERIARAFGWDAEEADAQ